MATEHVFIPPPQLNNTESVEDLILQKIAHKMRNGAAYARGKHLIVFSEAIGWWYPNRVGRRIAGQHEFASVWVVALERGEEEGFLYSVACLVTGPEIHPPGGYRSMQTSRAGRSSAFNSPAYVARVRRSNPIHPHTHRRTRHRLAPVVHPPLCQRSDQTLPRKSDTEASCCT
jgi:hypothetical protein